MRTQKSARQHWEQSYTASRYRVFFPALELYVGQKHPALDTFLIDNHVYEWAYVSACNPYSLELSVAQNIARHAALCQYLETSGYRFCEGQGEAVSGDWLPEKSVLVLDISPLEAMRLGKKMKQNAVVAGAINQVARLLWCVEK